MEKGHIYKCIISQMWATTLKHNEYALCGEEQKATGQESKCLSGASASVSLTALFVHLEMSPGLPRTLAKSLNTTVFPTYWLTWQRYSALLFFCLLFVLCTWWSPRVCKSWDLYSGVNPDGDISGRPPRRGRCSGAKSFSPQPRRRKS